MNSNTTNNAISSSNNPIVCYTCNKPGHISKQCNLKQGHNGSKPYVPPRQHRSTNGYANDSYYNNNNLYSNNNPSYSGYNQTKKVNVVSSPSSMNKGLDAITSKLFISGIPVKFLVDTGSSVSIINCDVFRKLRAYKNVVVHPCQFSLKSCSVDGNLSIIGKIFESISHQDYCESNVEFIVCRELEHECIIGLDVLSKWPKMRKALELMLSACGLDGNILNDRSYAHIELRKMVNVVNKVSLSTVVLVKIRFI